MQPLYHPAPHFVFLHGWGQSQQIWHQQRKHFPHSHSLNLPGHGDTQHLEKAGWLHHLSAQINTLASHHNIILVGWSLGGQLAIKLQQNCPIKGLVLVSSTPCFRQQENWTHGCSNEVWQGFSLAAEQQKPRLMQRFFQMMLHGDNLSRDQRNQVAKDAINTSLKPSQQGLQVGLSFLSTLDLRDDISQISVPTLIVHGQQDAIVPVQASVFLGQQIANSQQHIFQECGHAPFLTHHIAFNQLLEQWWKNISM